jgi:peptidoglycan/LPS O-acetylase OafA/YrhL
MNGLYESLSIILVFPLVVYLGASGDIKSKTGNKVCKFLGDISYPVYITHYAFIYIYTAWISNHMKGPHFTGALWYGVLTFVVSITVGYLSLRYYDEPVREWLKRKWG